MKGKINNYTLVSVSSLIPYINNSRTHSEEQVSQIAASISEFGFINPVIIDDEGGIIAGHGRVMAAKKLGMHDVPSITLSGLSEAQKKAYVIADNKLGETGGWNDELLRIEIAEIASLNFDIDVLGFSEKELSKIFDEMGGVSIDDSIEDQEMESVTVKFNPESKVEVLNSISAAVSKFGATIWCQDEQI